MASKQRPGAAANASARPNPFELRDQRKKHVILGRKSKGDKNKTGQARAAGIALRQRTLGVELQQKGKTNIFADQRFAEADETLPEEEKMLLRFQKERQSIFNLQDEETTLTHRGQALSSMNTFADDYAASEDEDIGEIDEQTVNAAHFGGGFEPKVRRENEEGENDDKTKTKKEVMEELIAKSKYYRAEKAKEKEEHSELKEKLDEEYREIAELLKDSAVAALKADKKPASDTYDVIVRELAFDLKARPSDRTKTSEELAREEHDRLELLEKQRMMRMSDHHVADGGPGGDDLDEGYFEAVEQARLDNIESGNELIRKKQTVALPFPAKGTPSDVDDLPFTITAPVTLQEMKKLTDKRSARDLHTIFNRVLVCTHPSLAAGNKEKLRLFYTLLLDFMLAQASGATPSAECLNAAYHALLTLSQGLPDIAAEQTRARLTLLQAELHAAVFASDAAKSWSHASFVCLLQYIANVYPVTDYQHSIVTPALLLAGQFLALYPIRTVADVSAGLLLSSVLISYVKPTVRYFPEVIGFIGTVIAAFHAKPITANPPQFGDFDLKITKQTPKDSAAVKTDLLRFALDLVLEYASLYKTNEGFNETFAPILKNLQDTKPIADLRADTKELHTRAVSAIVSASEITVSRRTPLQKLLRKPSAIRVFNPKYEERFDPTVSYDPDKERTEMQKLKKKLKREEKGASRELKKDAAFVHAEKEKKRMEQKKEVADRLKRAVSSLSAQDQEANLAKQDAKRVKARADRDKKRSK